MKILISTFGVRGDVQPYLALAVGLQRPGHRVTLATSDSFSQWIEAYGMATHPARFNMQAAMQTPEAQAVLKSKNLPRQLRLMRDAMSQKPAWAERVAQLGVGLRMPGVKQLTAEKLAEAMRTSVTDSALRAPAAALGEKIRAEDGVARAVEIVERHAATFKQRAPVA